MDHISRLHLASTSYRNCIEVSVDKFESSSNIHNSVEINLHSLVEIFLHGGTAGVFLAVKNYLWPQDVEEGSKQISRQTCKKMDSYQ